MARANQTSYPASTYKAIPGEYAKQITRDGGHIVDAEIVHANTHQLIATMFIDDSTDDPNYDEIDATCAMLAAAPQLVQLVQEFIALVEDNLARNKQRGTSNTARKLVLDARALLASVLTK
jgi:ribonucleotide reductase beta subunit family protein with ferritin-like domain